MTTKRKTSAEKRQEYDNERRRAWEHFQPLLEACNSHADALELLKHMPRPDTPPRCLYTNLLYFLDTLSPPGNSTQKEKQLYIELTNKMVISGDIELSRAEKVVKELSESMKSISIWEY